MYDPNTIFKNLAEVSDFIGMLHTQAPEFYFSPAKPIDVTQIRARLYGHIGTKQNPNMMRSMDFIIMEKGKAVHLYVIMEPAD